IKTSKQCKEKWSQVRKTYVIVHKICNASGLMYSLEHGANIGPQDEAVWDKFIKQNPGEKMFKWKGWCFYDKMKVLMPSKGKGSNV
ncbi:hypothetical protein PAXRUDRAFT_45590, partial [Paxillus rubicundulus Ve08.2h10]